MPTVIIDGREIHFDEHERLNGIQAARRAGIEIPYYCWHPGLTVVASCRMCLVEIGSRDAKTGHITMLPKLVPACSTPMKDGTVMVTASEKVRQARAMVEEDLLLRHPIDCPICDKAGECALQDYHFRYGQDERRADVRPFTSRRRDVGERVTLFVDRCVMCSRCVRFTREISGTGELYVTGRGSHEEIDVLPGFPLANHLSGNVVDLCPVGALGDKDFLYRQRVWYLRVHPGVCTGCSTGCSIWVEENQDHVYRLRPRENPHVNGWWICDEGRYGYHHVHSDRRILRPRRRAGRNVAGTLRVPSAPPPDGTILDWTHLPAELCWQLEQAGRLAAAISPHLTVEEAYLLALLVRSIDPEALLVVGPVPVLGSDESFPKGFTIRAEKCPNRRGVEAIVAHFTGKVAGFEELADAVAGGAIRGAWISGGYKTDWIAPELAARLEPLDLLVVQDLFASPLSERATYVLPGAAFAERDGNYVNHADRIQAAPPAIRPPGGVRTEGSLYWEMLGRTGLYNARAVLDEVARDVLYFSAAAGPLPEGGIDLKINLLA